MAHERILVADDHDSLRRGIARALKDAGHDVDEASNGNAAIELLHKGQFDVVLSDLKMGGSDGLDVLRTAKALHPTASVILMTGFGSVQTAVEAMKIGAFDFVQKPFEIEEMELRIAKALEHRRLKYEIDYLRHTQPDIYDFDRIVGASGALQRVLNIVRKVAQSNTTVLIRGETGTGKELIAGAIHHNSARASRNFVRVNCAALQENLLESELFGHEKGAFTGADRQRVGRFEQADGGSLFLDEVGDMSPNTQAKILRVLQEHEFERLGGTRTLRCDVRIVAATNRNLAEMVADGEFREDLYYRLNVVSIDMLHCASARRTFHNSRSSSPGASGENSTRRSRASSPRRKSCSSVTTGQATSESSRTQSSGPSSSPKGHSCAPMTYDLENCLPTKRPASTLPSSRFRRPAYRCRRSRNRRWSKRSVCRTGSRRMPPSCCRSAPG